MVQALTSCRVKANTHTGVGNNSIYCNGCKLWVHKKCSGLQGLTPNPDYRCARCMGNPTLLTADNRVRSSKLLAKLKLEDLDLLLRERRLRWFGHIAFYRTIVVQSEQHVLYRLMAGGRGAS